MKFLNLQCLVCLLVFLHAFLAKADDGQYIANRVEVNEGYIKIILQDGQTRFHHFTPFLEHATESARQDFELSEDGQSIYFYSLRKEMSLPRLFSEGANFTYDLGCQQSAWENADVAYVFFLSRIYGDDIFKIRCEVKQGYYNSLTGWEWKTVFLSYSFLHMAAAYSSPEVITALLDMGFSIDTEALETSIYNDKFAKGRDAIEVAKRMSNEQAYTHLMEITGRQESVLGAYLDFGTVIQGSAVPSYYSPADNLHLQSGAYNHSALKLGGGLIFGPLRFGVSMQPQFTTSKDLFATGQMYDTDFSFTKERLALEAYVDALNSSRFTPYGGVEWGHTFVNINESYKDTIDSIESNILFSRNTPYLLFGSGITIVLGRHPTPLNNIRTELDIGVRYERGDDSIIDGAQQFYFGGSNTTISVMLRWSPRVRRWW